MIGLNKIRVTFNKATPLETTALCDVDLKVPAGQFLTVIGSNGAGKSTALNVIAGLYKPDAGTVVIDGTDVTSWSIHQRARLISRVFQDPKMGTCENLTILENFALALGRTKSRGLRLAINDTVRDYARDRLKLLDLGLDKRLGDRVGLLSGGQRQALSLLMATSGETRVLLLDEHTAALDPKTASFVMDVTRRIVDELKLTVVMVTHSMAQALQFGERTVMFHRGAIIFDQSGKRRSTMKVADLLALFKRDQGEELSDDSLLLG
jgi:putative tryptophan/tyrosine transport system ATP-binding protein